MRHSYSFIRRSATVSVFVLAASLLNATTAQAAIPTWEPAGYLPSCDSVTTLSAAPVFAYQDATKPTIVSWSRTPIIRVGITTKSYTLFSARAKDACSGVLAIGVNVLDTTGSLSTLGGSPTSGTVHNAVHTNTRVIDPASVTFGKVTYLRLFAVDQFQSFQLTPPFTSPFTVTPSSLSTLASSQINYGQVTYIARDTRLTNTASRTSLRSGRTVTFSGKFSVADVSSYYGEALIPIQLQRRFKGANPWRTIATKNTGGVFADGTIGNISFAVKPTRSAYYRLVFSGKLRAPSWEAPVISASRLVTVT